MIWKLSQLMKEYKSIEVSDSWKMQIPEELKVSNRGRMKQSQAGGNSGNNPCPLFQRTKECQLIEVKLRRMKLRQNSILDNLVRMSLTTSMSIDGNIHRRSIQQWPK
jgi:hypothetical protein